jgi:hypothetical protein
VAEQEKFVDLASYKAINVTKRIRGNIIKSANISMGNSVQVGVTTEGKAEPIILLHRDGDRVIAAEFVCKCGRSATLHLDYEED